MSDHGTMIRKYREEATLTVRELSERSGVSEDTITKIENGHREPRPITLHKLYAALRVALGIRSPRSLRKPLIEETPPESQHMIDNATMPEIEPYPGVRPHQHVDTIKGYADKLHARAIDTDSSADPRTTIEDLVAIEYYAKQIISYAHHAKQKILRESPELSDSLRKEAWVREVYNQLSKITTTLPELTQIQSDIENYDEKHVHQALNAVLAGYRTGHASDDPYKDFRWNLRRSQSGDIHNTPALQEPVQPD